MSSKIIYVACPAYYATGGTELLHQLVYKIGKLYKIECFIYYTNVDWKFEVPPTPKRFRKYIDENYVTTVEDSERNIIIAPEVLATVLLKFDKAKTVLWWLSLDNFFLNQGMDIQTKKITSVFKNNLRRAFRRGAYRMIDLIQTKKNFLLNLSQSYYVFSFLKKENIQRNLMLSDFLNPEFFTDVNDSSKKLTQVVYNPSQGLDITEKLMRQEPLIDWVPIRNMSPQEVQGLMQTSKVYIDFGSHPGKDRMPREAAISGCCIITGKQGAAANSIDISIPNEYKFSHTELDKAIDKIQLCLSNYDRENLNFEEYRKKIRSEEDLFNQELYIFLEHIALL